MYEHIWEPRGLWRKFSGTVSGAELMRSNAAGQGDMRFDALRYVINDFRATEHFILGPDELEEIAATDGAAAMANSDIKIAVVSANPEILAVAESYMSAKLSPFPVGNFATLAEARDWLGC